LVIICLEVEKLKKSTLMLMGIGIMSIGGMTYLMMCEKSRNKAEKIICNALDEANDMIDKMN